MSLNAQYWINKLRLLPHPEGGCYAETFKSNDYNNEIKTPYSSSLIYFLLQAEQISAFHQLKSDEVWLFHTGSPVNVYIILPGGELQKQTLGANLESKQQLQVIIPANTWFAAELIDKSSYCLMSCLVTPGFVWSDFELAKTPFLVAKYPQHIKLIERLCKT